VFTSCSSSVTEIVDCGFPRVNTFKPCHRVTAHFFCPTTGSGVRKEKPKFTSSESQLRCCQQPRSLSCGGQGPCSLLWFSSYDVADIDLNNHLLSFMNRTKHNRSKSRFDRLRAPTFGPSHIHPIHHQRFTNNNLIPYE
jgi:hypothetical protein